MNFGTAQLTPQRRAPAGPLLASVDGQVARLSDEEVVFHDPRSGENHVMTLDVLAAMDASRRFLTLEEHTQRIAQRIPALKDKQHAIGKVFEFLQNRGLVVEAGAMLEQLQAEPRSVAAPAGLVIRTCDRPQELARLAESLAAYEAQTGRGLTYFVVDDSRRTAEENDAALSSLKDAGRPVHRLDRSWRQRLCATLPQPAVAAPLLGLADDDEATCGGAWNTAVLLTAGRRFLMLDDDFVLDSRRAPEARDSLLGISEPRHVPMHFSGKDMAELEENLTAGPEDLLAQHLEVCGQSPGALLSGELGLAAAPGMLRGASYGRIASLLAGQAIRTTAAGAWGDWRMDTHLWLYLADGADTAPLRTDLRSYRALTHRPVLYHGFPQAQLAEISNFTPLAFDNTTLMPCTVPTGRGEDFAFAAWLRYLYPDSLSLHLPAGLRHERPPGSMESPVATGYVPWFARFVGEYALSRMDQCQARRPEDRIRSLAGLLADLAAADRTTQETLVAQFLAMLRSQVIEQAQRALADLQQAPEFWVRDAREWITTNAQALTENGAPTLRGAGPDLTAPLAATAAQLSAWPALWEHCAAQADSLLDL
ncbi:MAG: hypothetical protein AAGA23_18490 [Pseudomonadota bacterium]